MCGIYYRRLYARTLDSRSDVSDTPKPSATVVVIRDADALEVLLLERQRGNAWVFPGGKIDAADGHG